LEELGDNLFVSKTMIGRTEERFGLKPERLAADAAYGSKAALNWIVNEKKIAPHIPGHRQIQARRRLVEPRRIHVRQGSQRLCVPAGQASAHDGQDP
jgi:hypothetical protein